MKISNLRGQSQVLLLSVTAWCAVPASMLLTCFHGTHFPVNDLTLWAAIFSVLLAAASCFIGVNSQFADVQRLGKLGVSLARLYLQVIGLMLGVTLIYWLTL